MRITILGHCGSGKTTLAKKLHTNHDLPHLELDRVWFRHGGKKCKTKDQKELVRKKMHNEVKVFISKNENWVIDGVYKKIQPYIINHATHVIYLQVPFYKRIYNHICRLCFSDRHPEISLWQDFCFTFKMIDHTVRTNKKLPSLLQQADKKLHVISENEIPEWITTTFKNT